MIKEVIKKRSFDIKSNRLGPDCPFTHWRLYFKITMKKLCKEKFGFFAESAEFRAGAYASGCSKIFIHDNVIIRPTTMMFADLKNTDDGYITIEKDVMIGSGVHMYVANHQFHLNDTNIINQGHSDSKSIHLKEGCWVGANSVILPGVIIGKNAVIGAGSIVTKNVPDRTLYAGNPAQLIRNI